MLQLVTMEETAGEVNLSGSMTRQVRCLNWPGL